MERLLTAIGWFLDGLGRVPLDDELGLGLYYDIEFKRSRTVVPVRTSDAVETDEEVRARAS